VNKNQQATSPMNKNQFCEKKKINVQVSEKSTCSKFDEQEISTGQVS